MRNWMKPSPYRTLFAIWLGWLLVLLGYQAVVQARFDLARPDTVLSWTASETQADSEDDQPYLIEPFMNAQVSWDSEFYLAIATEGYNSPQVRRVPGYVAEDQLFAGFWPFGYPEGAGPNARLSMSHAFSPGYPMTMRILNAPFSLLGMNSIATSTLSGVIVSAVGALAAMVALYELAKDELNEDGGIRAAFYLVVFPSGFFLAQVYTEGVFVGLAFCSLLLMRRGKLGWAALLAIAAMLTRGVGLALIFPLAFTWWGTSERRELLAAKFSWNVIGKLLAVILPLIAFAIWHFSYYGLAFTEVEQVFFGRGLFALESSWTTWSAAWATMFGENPQTSVYYAIEFAAIALGLGACVAGLRRYPDLAVFGLLVIVVSLTSGQAQGMHRYILAAPPVFLLLARWGGSRSFDRVWTLASVLLMAMMATLFTSDMWVG